MEKIKPKKEMTTIISRSVGSIVVKRRSKEVQQYVGMKHIMDYGVVMATFEEADEEQANV